MAVFFNSAEVFLYTHVFLNQLSSLFQATREVRILDQAGSEALKSIRLFDDISGDCSGQRGWRLLFRFQKFRTSLLTILPTGVGSLKQQGNTTVQRKVFHRMRIHLQREPELYIPTG